MLIHVEGSRMPGNSQKAVLLTVESHCPKKTLLAINPDDGLISGFHPVIMVFGDQRGG